MREIPLSRGRDQLVEVVSDAAELDCQAFVVDERVLAPGTGADRADAEPQRPLEPSEPLLVDVTGRDCIGLERPDLLGRSLGQDDVLDRRGRRVAAEHSPGLYGRAEAAQELEPVLAELVARPVRRLEHALVGLLVAEVERDEDVIRVAVDAGTRQLLQQLDALARLRPSLRDVPEGDDQVGAAILQIREGGPECDGVAVHVGEEGDAHTGTL